MRQGGELGLADLHVHSTVSDGMASQRHLVSAAQRAGLSVVCLTDHDAIRIPESIIEYGQGKGIDVVRGEEITTAKPSGTHILGLFLTRPIRMWMSLEDTIDAIHDEGGLAIVPHPFMGTFFASMTKRRFARLLETHSVDGIEIRHTAPGRPGMWKALDAFYGEHKDQIGAVVGASDSHFGHHDVGRLMTVFPGHTAADLRKAIVERTTSPLYGVMNGAPSLGLRLAQQHRALVQVNQERRSGKLGGGVGPRDQRG